jgi:hypothetical protein
MCLVNAGPSKIGIGENSLGELTALAVKPEDIDMLYVPGCRTRGMRPASRSFVLSIPGRKDASYRDEVVGTFWPC